MVFRDSAFRITLEIARVMLCAPFDLRVASAWGMGLQNLFEWTTKENIPHSNEATLLTQGLANFLVSEARKNVRQPNSKEDEMDMLIYNHPVTYTYKTMPTFGFDEVYFFDGNTPKPYAEQGNAASSSAGIQLN